MSKRKQDGDLKHAEGTFLGCCFDLLVGLSIIFSGVFVIIVGWIGGAGTDFYIFAAILFLFCFGIGIMEMKDAVESMKKLK